MKELYFYSKTERSRKEKFTIIIVVAALQILPTLYSKVREDIQALLGAVKDLTACKVTPKHSRFQGHSI